MSIRPLRWDEFEASLTLSEYAFQYKVAGEDRVQSEKKFKPERVWGLFEEEVLQAKLTLLPLEAYIQGKAVPMGGIAGVATWPEHRRQGNVAKLLTNTLKVMYEQGQELSFLHPFLIPFYRKFGWEVYCEYKKYTLPTAKFPPKTDMTGTVRRDAAPLETLQDLYDAYAVQYNGTLKRDEEWWKERVLDDSMHHCVFYTPEGAAQGYALYKIEKQELVIDEWVTLNEQARQAIWTFFSNHDSMVTGARLLMVPSDDMLPYLLPDPRITQEIHPYFMARIVNAPAFIGRLELNGREGLKPKNIALTDPYAPWNDGMWQWTVNPQGESSFVKLPEGTDTDLACDIGTLTAMLFGYKRPYDMASYGKLEGDKEALEWLEQLLPKAKTALFDFF